MSDEIIERRWVQFDFISTRKYAKRYSEEIKIKARRLYRNGFTLLDISDALGGVSCESISVWCEGILSEEERIESLINRKKLIRKNGRSEMIEGIQGEVD